MYSQFGMPVVSISLCYDAAMSNPAFKRTFDPVPPLLPQGRAGVKCRLT